PVRDELPAPLPGLRGQRSRLPAPGGPAELEHVVRSAIVAPDGAVPDSLLELQLVAVLDGGWHARRARRQHEWARAVEQPVVGARRRDGGPARHHILRSQLLAGWAGGAERSLPVGVVRGGG